LNEFAKSSANELNNLFGYMTTRSVRNGLVYHYDPCPLGVHALEPKALVDALKDAGVM
jgi:hypothetical protein